MEVCINLSGVLSSRWSELEIILFYSKNLLIIIFENHLWLIVKYFISLKVLTVY